MTAKHSIARAVTLGAVTLLLLAGCNKNHAPGTTTNDSTAPAAGSDTGAASAASAASR
jgi:hypothetical protein